jgi:UPF0755 protein
MLVLMALLGMAASPFLAAGAIMSPGPLTEAKTIVIPRGTNIHEIADSLDDNGVVYDSLLFRIASRFMVNNGLKAGEYEFTPRQSIADIVLMMHEGRSVVRTFTVTEGMTSTEVTHILHDSPALTGALTAAPAEGSLLPETYNYSYGDTRTGMIARMQKAMHEMLTNLWEKRDPELAIKTPQEAVIMASIIEKETGKADERARVAGVFQNRLRTNMRLQSDPTVIYAIVQAKGALDHTLDHDDLAFPSPYNTYTNDGLPPGPICNPGRAAIEAALHPEQNDYLYFVADGTGGHIFAHDLATHNQNVTHWNEVKPKP